MQPSLPTEDTVSSLRQHHSNGSDSTENSAFVKPVAFGVPDTSREFS